MLPSGDGWDTGRIPALGRAIARELPWHESGMPWRNYSELSAIWARQALDRGLPPTLIGIWFSTGRRVDSRYRQFHGDPPTPRPID
jgi:hypothetical protein